MQKYGVASLLLNFTVPHGSPPAPHEEDPGKHNRFSLVQWLKAKCTKNFCMHSCCSSERKNLRRSTTITSQKRVILHRAFGYVTARGLSYIPFLLTVNGAGVAVEIARDIILPLHGVLNFIAFKIHGISFLGDIHTLRSSW